MIDRFQSLWKHYFGAFPYSNFQLLEKNGLPLGNFSRKVARQKCDPKISLPAVLQPGSKFQSGAIRKDLYMYIYLYDLLPRFKSTPFINGIQTLEAQGVKERKLAGWGLSRGKAWKGSLNVTEKNAPQMEANTGIMEDAPTMKLFSSCCIWRRSRQPKWNGSWKASKLCILPGFHIPVMQKTLQIPLFLTRWTERGLNPRPQGYKPPGGGGG